MPTPIHQQTRTPAPAVWPTTRLVGAGLAVTTVVGAMSLGTALPIFIDILSIGLVLGPTLGLLLATYGVRGSMEAVRTLFGGAPNEAVLARSTSFFILSGGVAIGSGVVGVLVGAVVLLDGMTDVSTIGPAMAVIVLSSLYAVCWAIGSFCAAVAIARRDPTGLPAEATAGVAAAALVLSAVFFSAVPTALFALAIAG